ncbi:MAG: RnfABCDGE type electron transport complex subunit A [Bacilli bacterium]|jgi:electron transport complex protein RnfA|nr:RnfABCDGE type electron transport complex subunit A [Bacilli bacterium]
MSFFVIFMGAALVHNIILTQFLGICPFLGVSKKADQAIGMGAAVTFVIFLASLMAYCLNTYVLIPLNIEYLQTIAFILVIASLVQFVEMFLKKFSVGLYKSLGVFLPLITTNCAVLGTANNIVTKGFGLMETIIYSLGISIGFTLVMFVFATIRERLEIAPIARSFKGNPIALITAAIMALAFFGIGGLV